MRSNKLIADAGEGVDWLASACPASPGTGSTGKGMVSDQVAGRLKREKRRRVISYESIYRFINAQIRRTKDYSWRHYLPRGKSKRGFRGRRWQFG